MKPRERPARERKKVKYNVDEMLNLELSDEENIIKDQPPVSDQVRQEMFLSWQKYQKIY